MSFDRDRDKMRAERLVVLIDNDPVLSERLSAVLGSYGLRVQVIPDGNDLLTGAQLIFVLPGYFRGLKFFAIQTQAKIEALQVGIAKLALHSYQIFFFNAGIFTNQMAGDTPILGEH